VNEPRSQMLQMARTRETKARAAAWLERKDSGDWSEADQAALDSWLSESTANLIAYRRVDDVWARTERLVALRSPETGRAALVSRSRMFSVLLKTVAGVAVLAILGVGAALFLSAPQTQTYTTAVGARDTLTLPDGSRIELNTDTVVRVADTADQRKVWLDRGEAYFQVTHDAMRPFVVVAGDRRVTDVGTKFLMRREPDRLQVAVVDGRVQFEAGRGNPQSPPPILAAGDAVTATANSVVLTRKPTRDLANELGWLHGVFVFHHTALADAANEYNRYNRQKIVIIDPAVARLTLSGTLPTNNVKAFVDVARNFFTLNVERRGDEIVISR
jgi:transmembrane sensor